MSKFNVTIKETLSKSIEVEADTPEQAEEIVKDKYNRATDDAYILDEKDFEDCEFETELIPSPMKFRIYQVNTDRDVNKIAFMEYDSLEHFQGTKNIDSSVYDKVFDGEDDLSNLDDVFLKLNLEDPEDYTGRSLSVSDIVEIISSDTVKPGFYYCDTVGYKKVDFDPSKIPDIETKTIRVLLLEPNRNAKEVRIGKSLEDLQRVVGGNIEAAYYFEDPVCLVCNEEGKINEMPLNRSVYDKDNNLLDIIAGTAFICDCSGESFGSLNDEQMKKYKKIFKYPEHFFRSNGEIKGVKYNHNKLFER